MLKNYSKIAWRNISRNRIFASINIFGLAIGLASCLIIGSYIWDQVSYDSFHENKEKIYRIISVDDAGEAHFEMPPVLAPTVKEYFTTIDEAIRIWNRDIALTAHPQEGKIIEDNGLIYADNPFFEVFSFKLIQGNPKTVLDEPFSIVLTESTAKKYFQNQNPVGQQLTINRGNTFTITGIVENPPANSSIQFNFIASFSSLTHPEKGIWMAREAGWRSKSI